MTLWECLLVVLAGVGAGTINTIVGSGTLITFPTLLLMGVPPVTANMSNTVGLVAGGITGIHGYRRELVGARADLLRLVPMTFMGATLGAILLLVLDPAAFRAIVPVLILLGIVLVLAGPRLSALTSRRQSDAESPWKQRLMQFGVFVAGIYGGYFGAAQGVLLMGIMSILSTLPIQRLNGYKNVLGTVANAVAAVVFIVVAGDRIDWLVAGLIAIGALIGGFIGATVGRRLSPTVLRAVIAVIGLVAVVKVLQT
ncbi:MAG TPA: sulfite exporter TauE/SafE family protein [Phycicoccus sp.]|nr:sulfite exporter TauE/SafE family protein [Phycicoccus sp.]